jgi:hypothetical protein
MPSATFLPDARTPTRVRGEISHGSPRTSKEEGKEVSSYEGENLIGWFLKHIGMLSLSEVQHSKLAGSYGRTNENYSEN